MGLINLSTNLKSLPYGRDRFGGGSSNQPYITTPIPDIYNPGSYDFILRQGALQNVALNDLPGAIGVIRQIGNITDTGDLTTDALRISKLFTDPLNPAGQLFITKQTLLERQSVKIPGGFGRFYNSNNTLAQINNISYGVHLNKQGIDGTNLSYAQGGLFGYYNFTLRNDQQGDNRLSLLYETKIGTKNLGLLQRLVGEFDISNQDNYSIIYNGGPDSVGGVGITRIRLAGNGSTPSRDRTNNYKLFQQGGESGFDDNVFTYDSELLRTQNIGATVYTAPSRVISRLKNTSVVTDYRKIINDTNANAKLISTPYETFNRENTYGINATVYKATRVSPNLPIAADSINTSTIPVGVDENDPNLINLKNKDLISFYFQVINPSIRENRPEYLFFRAYINSLSDNFKGEWSNYKYVGRAENFYKYSGFGRDIQLSFTIYAHSRAEMLPLYSKINKLAGVTAPTYSERGFMMGNILKITVGNYFNQVPGVMTQLSLKPNFEGGWDINRDEMGNILTDQSKVDTSNGPIYTNVGQLPRMIDVDMSFTPVHDFTPRYNVSFINNKPYQQPIGEGQDEPSATNPPEADPSLSTDNVPELLRLSNVAVGQGTVLKPYDPIGDIKQQIADLTPKQATLSDVPAFPLVSGPPLRRQPLIPGFGDE